MLKIALEHRAMFVNNPLEIFGIDEVKSVITLTVLLQFGYFFKKQFIFFNSFLLLIEIFFLKVFAKIGSSDQTL